MRALVFAIILTFLSSLDFSIAGTCSQTDSFLDAYISASNSVVAKGSKKSLSAEDLAKIMNDNFGADELVYKVDKNGTFSIASKSPKNSSKEIVFDTSNDSYSIRKTNASPWDQFDEKPVFRHPQSNKEVITGEVIKSDKISLTEKSSEIVLFSNEYEVLGEVAYTLKGEVLEISTQIKPDFKRMGVSEHLKKIVISDNPGARKIKTSLELDNLTNFESVYWATKDARKAFESTPLGRQYIKWGFDLNTAKIKVIEDNPGEYLSRIHIDVVVDIPGR